MPRKPYPSDLNDAEWTKLKPLLPAENRIGSPREVELREVMSALMYVADNGIKWRAMPHDLPAWQTVYGYFRRWSQSGVWEQVNQALGKQVRLAAERDEQPSLGLIDSQSVEMAQKGDLNKVSMATRRSKDASGTWLLMC
jgi:putative transposase